MSYLHAKLDFRQPVTTECTMNDTTDARPPDPLQELPLGQRLFDNWLLLMIAGILIMAVIYTGWGLWEISTMPQATLP
jgi:hypothetical protein